MIALAHRQSLAAIFALPLLLAALVLTGLIGALLADGVWDVVGAVLIASPGVAVVWARVAAARRVRGG